MCRIWQAFFGFKSPLEGLTRVVKSAMSLSLSKKQKAKRKFDTTGCVWYASWPMWLWPFRKTEPPKSVKDRFDELETRTKRLETGFKLLEDEWEQVYQNYRLAMAKLARRDMRAAQPVAPPPAAETEAPLTLMAVRQARSGILPR